MSIRPLIALNPGRQSRNYMLGLLRAAETLGLAPLPVEMLPLREQFARAPDPAAAVRSLADRFRPMVEAAGITDVITYADVAGPEFGCWQTPRGPGTLWAALGLRQHILWTDHPEWVNGGAVLEPKARALLAHPAIHHRLKSAPAAAEASDILGWPGIEPLPVAEDYDAWTPAAADRPAHDAVAIVGSLARIPDELGPYLACDDPDPAEMDRAMTPRTLKSWDRIAQTAEDPESLRRLATDLLEARAAHPFRSVWEHARALGRDHAGALAWLTADPQRWYPAQARLRQQGSWRRSFWLAWVARRLDLGVYGCDASPLGIDQPAGADQWVGYRDQASVYARGRCALNINQSHDEAGVTHKPFQIVASCVPLVHHAGAGLTELFTPGREIMVFCRGPELLHRIDSLCARRGRGPELAAAALERARTEHAWTNRLQSMLGLSPAAAARAAA
jgi:hypothetical protein